MNAAAAGGRASADTPGELCRAGSRGGASGARPTSTREGPAVGGGEQSPQARVPVVLASGMGPARGARPAAAALACAAAELGHAPLFLDLKGSPPRETAPGTASARDLEAALRPQLRAEVAASGVLCRVVPASPDGDLDTVAAALAIARRHGSPAVVVVPDKRLMEVLKEVSPSAVLLCADLRRGDGYFSRKVVRQVTASGVPVSRLKRPISWLSGHHAILGTLRRGAPDWPPPELVHGLFGRRAE